MNWVRINTSLPTSPKLIAVARELSCTVNEALGLTLCWLCWLDTHTTNGKSGLLAAEADEMIFNHEGASRALKAVGWAYEDENMFLCSSEYEKYNSPTAKAKTLAAARQKKSRLNKKSQQQHNKN